MRQLYSDGPYTQYGSGRPNQGVASPCLSNFGVDRCPVKLRIPKKQKRGASECPDPTPYFKMFVCPRCGFKDDPCWRAHRYMLYVVYTEIDTLAQFQPKLAERLRLKTDVEEGPYAYHLTSSGYVLRTTIELKDFMYKRGLIERHIAATDRHQVKLLPQESEASA